MLDAKYAHFQILGSVLAAPLNRKQRRKWATFDPSPGWLPSHTLVKGAHRHEFEYEPRPGYLYVRSRAISSRCNDNYDEFPANEIKLAYRTFIGRPVFVNHNNSDHRRARGVIVDATLHEDALPDGGPDTWVEVLMEVDANKFPKLCKAIIDGHIDRTSMGTDVAYSECSACGNRAETPADYCKHIPAMKGKLFRRATANGVVSEPIREICYGLGFFENSLLVEEPADPTAFTLGVDTRGLAGMQLVATRGNAQALVPSVGCPVCRGQRSWGKVGGHDLPCGNCGGLGWAMAKVKIAVRRVGVDEIKVPDAVDTMREEECPVCGEADSLDEDGVCEVCGFITPEGFGDPDTEQANLVDLHQDAGGQLTCDQCGATFPMKSKSKPKDKPNKPVEQKPTPPKQPPPTKGPPQDKKMSLYLESAFPFEKGDDEAKDEKGDAPPKGDDGEKKDNPFDDEQDDEEDDESALSEGDTCPECGEGQLVSDDESEDDPDDSAEDSEEDSEEDDAEDQDDQDSQPTNDQRRSKPKMNPKSNPQDVINRQGAALRQQRRANTVLAQRLQAESVRMADLLRVVQAQGQQITKLTNFVQNVAVPHIASMRKAQQTIARSAAPLKRRSDINNPAQPIPDPPAQAAPFSTEETEAPDATTTPEEIGGVSGVDSGLTPDATTDPTVVGAAPITDVAPDAVIDVQAPTAGTDEVDPDGARWDTDPNATPASTEVFEPVNLPKAPTVSSASDSSARHFAAQRLAKLRVDTEQVPKGTDPIALGASIDRSTLSNEMIQHEIDVLSGIARKNANAQRPVPRPTRTVERGQPSFSPSSTPLPPSTASLQSEDPFALD